MPRYDYTCIECDITIEYQHRMGESPTFRCPNCGYAMVRVIAPSAISFKGPGFYSTDNPKR